MNTQATGTLPNSGRIVVVGQAARDLVLLVGDLPAEGRSAPVLQRRERLGGKGANIAVGIRQLNGDLEPVLVAVLGNDEAGEMAHGEAIESGIDTTNVVHRGRTALLLDLVTEAGDRRLLEDVPSESLLSTGDIAGSAPSFQDAGIVILQLQQPPEALIKAAHQAADAGAAIVLDGAVEGTARDSLLGMASLVRADAHEARLLTGIEVEGRQDAIRAAARVLAAGPKLAAIEVPNKGDLLVWQDGDAFYPHEKSRAVDPTGAGDAFIAGLVTGLRRGYGPRETGQLAARAASMTVNVLGGRPDLTGLSGARPG